MKPREYQLEALNAIDTALAASPANPCIVLPTASGKTPVMAWKAKEYVEHYNARILVLAHAKELLAQGIEKLLHVWPDAPAGVYSAGLKKRQTHAPITYASIQSIHKKAFSFDPFDLIFVDEAHRIPLHSEGRYREFIKDAKLNSPHLRVVGFTATPYRLGGGPICGPDYILNDVAYEANVGTLIRQGYLCPLKSKAGDNEADLSGVRIRKGEYAEADLNERLNVPAVVQAAVGEALAMLEGRVSVLWFGCSVDHAGAITAELHRRGESVHVVTGKTPAKERDDLITRFKSGEFRHLVNVNILTEGFDAPRVDAVVMLRPTQSTALYYQIVGRGLRLHPDKQNTLILDFAGNILRHGPIDNLIGDKARTGKGQAPVRKCPGCKELLPITVLECPECGYEFPEPERSPRHETHLTGGAILSEHTWDLPVLSVAVQKHQKADKTPSLRVTYYGQLQHVNEWVCLEHSGFAGRKAKTWWWKRFGEQAPATVDDALSDMFLGARINNVTRSLTLRQAGRYPEIIDYQLEGRSLRHAIAG